MSAEAWITYAVLALVGIVLGELFRPKKPKPREPEKPSNRSRNPF